MEKIKTIKRGVFQVPNIEELKDYSTE